MATASARKLLARLRPARLRPARHLRSAAAAEALEARQLMAADVSCYGATAPSDGIQDLVKFSTSNPTSFQDLGAITNAVSGFTIQALSRDPASNLYYAFGTDGGGGGLIERIDPTTLATTLVAQMPDTYGFVDGPDAFYADKGSLFAYAGGNLYQFAAADGTALAAQATSGAVPAAQGPVADDSSPSPTAYGISNAAQTYTNDGKNFNQGPGPTQAFATVVGLQLAAVSGHNSSEYASGAVANGGGTEYDLFSVNISDGTTTKIATLPQALRGLSEIALTPTLHVAGIPASVTAGQSYTVTVTADPGDGTTDTAYSGTVHFTSTDGQATLPADATLINGTGTFDVTFKTAGPQTITAADTANPADTGTESGITVANAAADHYVVTGGVPAAAGTAESYTVTAYDPYGNVVADANYAAAVSTTDTQAVAPATVTFAAGVGTFQATLKTAGTQTVTVSDPDAPSVRGSQAVAITPGALTQFAISVPSSLVAGVTGTVTVTAEDAYGNVETGYNAAPAITDSDDRATLPPSVTLVNGVGSFLLTPITAGASTLAVADPGAEVSNSTTLAVAPGALDHLVVLVNESGYVAGTAGTVTVTAYDAYGNVETGNNDAVTLTSADPNATFAPNAALVAGTGTFSATFLKAGSQSVSAVDAAASEIIGSADAAVTPGATASYTVQGPATALAGASNTFTVTAYDAYGNLATGDGSTVHFTSTDPAADLPADVALAGGEATVAATFHTAGSQTLTASEVEGPATGTSAGIAVAGFIQGTVFLDTNANGVLDDGEAPLAGRVVYLDLDGSGAFKEADPTATTDAQGHFAFSGYAAGSHAVIEDTTQDAVFRYVVDQTATLADGSLTIGAIPYSPVAPIPTAPGAFTGNRAGGTEDGFVRALYKTVLGRAGSDAEVAGWVSQLDAGMTAGQVALAFNTSPEHRVDEVASYYRDFLGRDLDPTASFWVDRLMNGATEASVVEGILGSSEYDQAHADSSTFARDLYLDVLGRQGGESEVQGWVDELTGGMSRAEVVASFVESQEANDRAVESLYNTALHRGRQDGTSDYWVGMLASKKSAALVAANILSSAEFLGQADPV